MSNGECVPDVECGPGTSEVGGECVPDDPDDTTVPVTTVTPAGRRARIVPEQVVLASDERTTIYYTRDGSEPTTSSTSAPSPITLTDIVANEELKFFAVDGNANQESVQTAAYIVDLDGPGPVQGLAAALTGADVGLSWTNPTDADLGGVVIAASIDGVVTSAPEDGTLLSAGDSLPGGELVIYAGTGTAAADALTGLGVPTVYAAWTHDDLGNYSRVRVSNGVSLPLPAETGTLSVALGPTAVTVTAQPADLTLSATAALNGATDTLTVTLTVQNDTARLLFGLKALTTTVNQGTQSGVAFGGDPMTYYGPGALEPAGALTRTLTFTGIDGAVDPIIVDLSFVEHPMIYSSFEVTDTSGAPGTSRIPHTLGQNRVRGAVMSRDGRFIYAAHKSNPGLAVLDTATMEPVAVAHLSDVGSVGGIASSVTATQLYVLFNDGGDYRGGSGNGTGTGFAPAPGNTFLLVLDAVTLEETGRVAIGPEVLAMTGRNIYVSPGGDTAAVLLSRHASEGHANEVWFVDLPTLTIIDTDAATAGDQPVVLTGVDSVIEQGTWTPDGSALFIGYNDINEGSNSGNPTVVPPLVRIDTTSYAVTSRAVTNAGMASGIMAARGSKLYYTSRNNGMGTPTTLTVIDLPTGAETTPDHDFGPTTDVAGVVFHPSGDRYYFAEIHSNGGTAVAIFDAATDTRIDADGDASNGVTNLLFSASPHMLVVSPF